MTVYRLAKSSLRSPRTLLEKYHTEVFANPEKAEEWARLNEERDPKVGVVTTWEPEPVDAELLLDGSARVIVERIVYDLDKTSVRFMIGLEALGQLEPKEREALALIERMN